MHVQWRLRFQWLPLSVLNEAYNLGAVKDNAIYQLHSLSRAHALHRPTHCSCQLVVKRDRRITMFTRNLLALAIISALLMGCGPDSSSDDTSSTDTNVPDDTNVTEDTNVPEDTNMPDVSPDVPSVPDITISGEYLEPPDGRMYHGASCYSGSACVDAYVQALGDEAVYPLVEGIHMSIPSTRPDELESNIRNWLDRVRDNGRVPHLSLAFQAGDGNPKDVQMVETDELDIFIDMVAVAVADYGDPMFVRLGFEFNGIWNGYTPGVYPIAFRKVVDRFRDAGVDNAAYIWCYTPGAPGTFDATEGGEWLWYPGDDYVDWFGLDVFQSKHFTPTGDNLPDDPTKVRADAFLEMAVQHGKPVFISEASAVFTNITPDELDPGSVDGTVDWNSWFQPWFDWLHSHPEIKGFMYLDEDFTGYPNNWGDARIENNSYVLEHFIDALGDPAMIHRNEGLTPE